MAIAQGTPLPQKVNLKHLTPEQIRHAEMNAHNLKKTKAPEYAEIGLKYVPNPEADEEDEASSDDEGFVHDDTGERSGLSGWVGCVMYEGGV